MSEPANFDLDAYCRRIGYGGPRTATLATLGALHALQPATIPFENLDPLLGRPVALDLPSLQGKLVDSRRGGYCFELNGLFRAALEAIGFAITPLIARVRWMAPPDRPDGPRTHMLLRVDLAEGSYLADVGFGGHLADEPLPLRIGADHHGSASHRRLVEAGAAITLQTALPHGWQDVYRFTQEPAANIDYEVGNWWTSTHPAALFKNALLAERLVGGIRHSLFNRKLTIRAPGGASERILPNAAALEQALTENFAIGLPVPADEIWARIPE